MLTLDDVCTYCTLYHDVSICTPGLEAVSLAPLAHQLNSQSERTKHTIIVTGALSLPTQVFFCVN